MIIAISGKWFQGLATAALLAAVAIPGRAQPPFTCLTSVGVTPIAETENHTAPVGDTVLDCTGGVPTIAGQPVPQMNFTIFFNTNITSKELASIAPGGHFSEALLLVDEPNTPTVPRKIFNCGQTGAPDTGPSGHGVCSIVSTGTAAHTYDGTANGYGLATCDGLAGRPAPNHYGCGRPNTFQGRVGTITNPHQLNAVTFVGVPVDPPGTNAVRILRFTNFRANAAAIGIPRGPLSGQIQMNLSVNGPIPVLVANPQQIVAFVNPGLLASVSGAGTATPSVKLIEGFASSWQTKNISFTVGDNGGMPGNATFSTGNWVYNLGTHYPRDDAQNIPGMVYNTETLFEWRNNSSYAPPLVNPPPGFGFIPGSVANLGDPLASASTGIHNAGRANSGRRIAIRYNNIPHHATVTIPSVVHVYRQGCLVPCTPTGVMVLTNTDSSGAGAFNSSVSTTLHAGNNVAVYEILYADPFSLEYATVSATVSPASSAGPITETVSFAPFYTTAAAGEPSASLPVPRFVATP